MLCDLAKHFPPAHLFGFLPLCQTENQQLEKILGLKKSRNRRFSGNMLICSLAESYKIGLIFILHMRYEKGMKQENSESAPLQWDN